MLRRDKPGTAQNVEIGDGDRNQMKKTTAKYEYVLFDLDGTLTDPALGITNSVMYALKKFGISVSDRSELFRFIGPPLMYSFKTYYGFDDEKAKLALDLPPAENLKTRFIPALQSCLRSFALRAAG